MVPMVKYDEVDEEAYVEYIEEWERAGETIVPMSSDRRGRSFADMRKKWTEDETDLAYQKGFVPSTLFFLVDGTRVLGSLSYRPRLNERLLLNGGSIGYRIRPSERRKGYGSGLLIAFLRSDFIGATRKFLLTCDETNEGSRRVIEAAGGVLQDHFLFEGTWTRRYWIEL